jgi:hypothetical protein
MKVANVLLVVEVIIMLLNISILELTIEELDNVKFKLSKTTLEKPVEFDAER